MNQLHWVDKYRPQKIEDVIGNEEAIRDMKDWLDVFVSPSKASKSFKNGLVISGPPGVGKTTCAHLLLHNYGFDVIEFNASELRTSKEISEKLGNILSANSVSTMFKAKSINSVIMDEIDGIESKKEYSATDMLDYVHYSEKQFETLQKQETRGKKSSEKSTEWKTKRCWNGVWVNKNPLIFICNELNKNITPLLRHCLHVRFQAPSDHNVYQLIKRISEAEGMRLNDVTMQLLVPSCQNDHRRTVYVLDQLQRNATSAMRPQDILTFTQHIGSKDIDIDLFDAIQRIFTSSSDSVDEMLRCFESDHHFVPFLVHENFIPFVEANVVAPTTEKIDLCLDYYESLMNSQLFKEELFGNWDLGEYIGIFSSVIPNFHLRQMKCRQTLVYTKFEKSAMISKYNYRFYNMKAINHISKKIHMDIINFQTMGSFVLHSIFHQPTTLKHLIQYISTKGLSYKKMEKMIKLTLGFDEYEKAFNKKCQRNLQSLYEKFNGVGEDEEDDVFEAI